MRKRKHAPWANLDDVLPEPPPPAPPEPRFSSWSTLHLHVEATPAGWTPPRNPDGSLALKPPSWAVQVPGAGHFPWLTPEGYIKPGRYEVAGHAVVGQGWAEQQRSLRAIAEAGFRVTISQPVDAVVWSVRIE